MNGIFKSKILVDGARLLAENGTITKEDYSEIITEEISKYEGTEYGKLLLAEEADFLKSK